MWTEKAMTNMGGQGKVFCYFGPTWFIDYVIGPYAEWNQNDNSTGDWAFCKGPESFNWGGTLICAAAGSDNIPLVKDILQKLTCDEKIMERLALETGDFANNEKSMKSVSESGYTNKVLGGQNHIPILIEAAKSIEKKAITNYDAARNSILMESMEDYFANRTTENAAWKKFYLGVKEAFPEIGIPVTLEEERRKQLFSWQQRHKIFQASRQRLHCLQQRGEPSLFRRRETCFLRHNYRGNKGPHRDLQRQKNRDCGKLQRKDFCSGKRKFGLHLQKRRRKCGAGFNIPISDHRSGGKLCVQPIQTLYLFPDRVYP
jgi:hypothetical protein